MEDKNGKKYYNLKVSEEKVREWLAVVKKLSGGVADLNIALQMAFYRSDEKSRETLIFVQKLLREIASGTVRPDFNIFEIYERL